jgi:hypothetical protein
MAGTDSICAVPIRRWNGWRICPTCPVRGGPGPSESACCCLSLSTTRLCQYRAQPEGFTGKLAWHRDHWHHCEIGTPDPVVYIVQLSHILGRLSLLLLRLPARNFGTIHLLLLATCIFRFIHADTGIYMHIHSIHADTCKILHVCIWYV